MRLKYYIFILASIFFLKCKNNEAVDQPLIKEVISLIINEIAIPVPPPPPPSPAVGDNLTNQSLSKKKIDSIKSIKLSVGLNPKLIKYEPLISNAEKYPSNFISLIEEIPLQDTKDISNINIGNITKHNVEFVTWDGKSEMKNFDVFVKISNIIWSKDKTRAAAIAIRKLGKFDGTTYLFLFERGSPKEEITIYKKYVLLKS